jgi:hypothetical protein
MQSDSYACCLFCQVVNTACYRHWHSILISTRLHVADMPLCVPDMHSTCQWEEHATVTDVHVIDMLSHATSDLVVEHSHV